ncbi:MAG: hypothetical protein K2F74_03235, partial [Muribaculaceae bacterium]|nr:hypothetical protein [Muribaculaceae bacterium]
MKKYKLKPVLAGIAVGAMLLSACGGEKNTESTPADSIPDSDADSIETLETKPENIKLSIITDEIQPEESVIIFDASSSMKGYVDATVNGDFPGVIAELNGAGKRSSAYVFDVKKTPVSNFLSKLQHKDIKWANESDLFGMVSEIFNSANSNPANCYALVTDGIMSGSNAEIKADPTYNISKPAILECKIDSIVKRQPLDKNLSLLVVSCQAPFNGTYYAYDNSKKTLKNEPRPFYVLIAGGTAQINYLAKNMQKRNGMNMIQYGAVYPMSIGTNAKRQKSNFKYDKSVDGDLTATLNIENLPAYAKNINYLRKNLEIVKTGRKGNKTTLRPETEDGEGDYAITVDNRKAEIVFSQKTMNTL